MAIPFVFWGYGIVLYIPVLYQKYVGEIQLPVARPPSVGETVSSEVGRAISPDGRKLNPYIN